jgi:hypothetical protein
LYSLYLCLFHAKYRFRLCECILFSLRHVEGTQYDVKVGRVRLCRANCCVRAKVLATESGRLNPESRTQARPQDGASSHPSREPLSINLPSF